MKRSNVIFILLIMVYLSSCSASEKTDQAEPMTYKEYLILKNTRVYFQNKDFVEPKEAVSWIKQFFISIPDNEVSTTKECGLLSVQDLTDLFLQTEKSQWLRDNGFYLFNVEPMPERTIFSHKSVLSTDLIDFGRCRHGNNNSRLDAENFRQKVRIRNLSKSQVSFYTIQNEQLNLLKGELAEKGELLELPSNSELNPDSKAYKYKGILWSFSKDYFRTVNGATIHIITLTETR